MFLKCNEKITFLLKKKKFCLISKIRPVWFYSLDRNYFFWVKHNETSLVQNMLFCFFKFHDVKTEISMSCKELCDEQCSFVQYIKSGNT